MLSFIIYDKSESQREVSERIVKNFLYTSEECYKIYHFDKYTTQVQKEIRSIEGLRIFLINVDEQNSNGLSLARMIRHDGDFISPIILLTAMDRSKLLNKIHNILFLDIVNLDDRLVQNLMINLREAYKIVTRHSVFTFSIFDEVYRIPYNDIYYIKKNLKDDSVTIYTKDDSYLHYTTVKCVDEVLRDDARFFKSHRSAIVNLYNVASYDRKDNIIVFKNGMTMNLVARAKKGELSLRLKDFCNDRCKI